VPRPPHREARQGVPTASSPRGRWRWTLHCASRGTKIRPRRERRVFALDGGALGDGRGGAFYLAPDTLEWRCVLARSRRMRVARRSFRVSRNFGDDPEVAASTGGATAVLWRLRASGGARRGRSLQVDSTGPQWCNDWLDAEEETGSRARLACCDQPLRPTLRTPPGTAPSSAGPREDRRRCGDGPTPTHDLRRPLRRAAPRGRGDPGGRAFRALPAGTSREARP
jgi:hypothetical protein